MKLAADSDDNELKPIGYEVNKPVERVKKDRIGDTSVNTKKVLLTSPSPILKGKVSYELRDVTKIFRATHPKTFRGSELV